MFWRFKSPAKGSQPAESRYPRLEIRLLRELEAAYSSGRPPPDVAGASPYQWANTCHDLFETGRIDLLEFAARHLHARYPRLTYLATMVERFDAVPRDLPGLLAFTDNPAAEIQLIHRPNCDAIILCFCALEGTLGLPLNFIHQWLGRLPVSLLYIKDSRDLSGGCGYRSLGPDRESSVAELAKRVSELEVSRVFTFGVSHGGYPALYYGLQLDADAVLTLGGATNLTRAFNERFGPLPTNYANVIEQAPDYAINLRDVYATAFRPHLLLAFSKGSNRDRLQAEQLAGLPNVELLPVEGHSHHNVIDPLIRRREFLPLLYRFLSLA
jgi:hypothetical protein